MFLLLITVQLGLCLAQDGCVWEWSQWSSCDAGPCASPRNQQDRLRRITKAPLLGSDQCPFAVDLGSGEMVETRQCSSTDACYDVPGCNISSSADFQCDDGSCVSPSLVCNSDLDCPDGSDETGCQNTTECPFKMKPTFPSDTKWFRGNAEVGEKYRGGVLNIGFFNTCVEQDIHESHRLAFNTIHVTRSPQTKIHLRMVTSFVECIGNRALASLEICHVYFGDGSKAGRLVAEKTLITDTFDIRNSPLLDAHFEKDLQTLPTVLSYKLYGDFVAKYGTHYTSHTVRGGQLILVSNPLSGTEVDRTEMQDFLQSPSTERLEKLSHSYTGFTVFTKGGSTAITPGTLYDLGGSNTLVADMLDWEHSLPLQSAVLKLDSQQTPLYELVGFVKKLSKERQEAISTNLRIFSRTYLSTYQDTLCNCNMDETPLLQPTDKYGCICVESTFTESKESKSNGWLVFFIILVILLLIGIALMAVYRYRQLMVIHPTMKKAGKLQRIQAVFLYKGVTKQRRKKVSSLSSAANEPLVPSPKHTVPMFELTDPVVTADTNVNIHQPEDEPLQQKDEEVESEEEEDTEQQQEAIPLQPLLPPPPAVTERGCQASIGPPVQDINLQTESYVDFLGFYDNIKGSDLTILPDRRIAVSTQDNKVILVTIGLAESKCEVTSPQWQHPQGIAFHLRKDSPVMSTLLVADVLTITHWKPNDQTFWPVRLKHVGESKTTVLDKYTLLDVDVLADDRLIILAEKHSSKEYRLIIINRDGVILDKWELDRKGRYRQIKAGYGTDAVFVSDINSGSIVVFDIENGHILTTFKVTKDHPAANANDSVGSFTRNVKRASFRVRGSFRQSKRDKGEKDKGDTMPSSPDKVKDKSEHRNSVLINAESQTFAFCLFRNGDLLVGTEAGVHVWTLYGTCKGQLLRTDENVRAIHIHEELLAILTDSQVRLYSVFGVPILSQAPAALKPVSERLQENIRISYV